MEERHRVATAQHAASGSCSYMPGTGRKQAVQPPPPPTCPPAVQAALQLLLLVGLLAVDGLQGSKGVAAGTTAGRQARRRPSADS